MTEGLDLHLGVDKRAGFVGRALETALREAIRSGRLHAGARLPGSRSLAADLGISRGTVVQAYAQLIAEYPITAAGFAAALNTTFVIIDEVETDSWGVGYESVTERRARQS